LGCAPDTLLVTLVARFQSVKGHDVFLEAARQAAARSNRFRFAMAGENIFARSADDRLKGRTIRRIEADSSLRERVRFLGWVDQPEKVLAASDVVVCSSRFESFGMVLVEAMATEVPVVSTNVGGPAEIVIDGETGFLVPPGRPELIVQRLMRLSEDDGLRQRMGQAGRRRAIGEFGLDRYAAEFTRNLEAAISGSTESG
jgi:glycosyltransferase involved in cell wall biosynthesis